MVLHPHRTTIITTVSVVFTTTIGMTPVSIIIGMIIIGVVTRQNTMSRRIRTRRRITVQTRRRYPVVADRPDLQTGADREVRSVRLAVSGRTPILVRRRATTTSRPHSLSTTRRRSRTSVLVRRADCVLLVEMGINLGRGHRRMCARFPPARS